MIRTKIVIVGGGDYKTAPKLLGDILATKKLNGADVVLYGMDERPLEVMRKLSVKMIDKVSSKCTVTVSTDMEDALQGADFVVANIYVGSWDGMRSDIEIPLNFGIYQSMAEATGPGGIFRALRTVPVFMELIKEMERFCPDAWLINLTQPIDILCRMVDKTSSIKVIGVSDDLPDTLAFLKKVLRVDKKKDSTLTVKVGGINRMGWLLDVRTGQESGMEQLARHILGTAGNGGSGGGGGRNRRRGRKGGSSGNGSTGGGGEDQRLIKFELFRLFGYLPYAEDRKLAEYFPYFLTQETNRGEKYGVRTVNLKRIRNDLKAVKDKIERVAESSNPVGFNKTQSEFADIIGTLAWRDEGTFVMNIPNKGSISNLPVEAIVEVPVLIKDRKLMPQFIGDLPAGVAGVIEPHVIKQGLVMEAALKGSRELVRQALALDPLVRSITCIDKLTEQMVNAHKEYLPQFFLVTEPVLNLPKPEIDPVPEPDGDGDDDFTDETAAEGSDDTDTGDGTEDGDAVDDDDNISIDGMDDSDDADDDAEDDIPDAAADAVTEPAAKPAPQPQAP